MERLSGVAVMAASFNLGLCIDKVISAGMIDGVAGHFRGSGEKACLVNHMINQVTGMAGIEGDVVAVVPVLNQVLINIGFESNRVHLADTFENLQEFYLCRVLNLDLVTDAAKKGFIDQGFWIQIGGKDNQLVKGDFEFHAGVH